MDTQYDIFPPVTGSRGRKEKRNKYGPQTGRQAQSFVCSHCHNHVITLSWISGVQNRNHCPYCLWSRHLDLHAAGDRLAACKGRMRPVGVALKRAPKKYGDELGELMLAHRCEECGKLSLNRIAADDDTQAILAVFEASLKRPEDAALLGAEEAHLVHARLFGRSTVEAPAQG
jgi:hypothetical protein